MNKVIWTSNKNKIEDSYKEMQVIADKVTHKGLAKSNSKVCVEYSECL